MPRFKSIIFYQNSPKIKFFLKKNAKFLSAVGSAPDSRTSGGWGLCPQTPKTVPPNANFWLRAWQLCTVPNYTRFRSFCFKQFFLDRSVANLMMLTTDVCLMPNCVLFEKFYLHYALCDFDSILWHYTKLFICQSIDREQIFDITFWTPPPIEKSCVRHC